MDELTYRLEVGSGTVERALETEWLLPDELGGFAMGTALGVPTRRYHGLLVAAVHPPVERVAVLTQIVERLVLEGGGLPGAQTDRAPSEHWLTPLRFESGPRPTDAGLLTGFEKGPSWVRWVFSLPDGGTMEKRLDLARRRNAARVRYRVEGATRGGRLELRPLLALRDFHALLRRDMHEYSVRTRGEALIVAARQAGVLIEHEGLTFDDQREQWRHLYYEWESRRGLDCAEDLFMPRRYLLKIEAGRDCVCELRFSAEAESGVGGAAFQPAPVPGLEYAVSRVPKKDDEARRAVARLAEAASTFVVGRKAGLDGRGGVTVIAGYPWFSDWGRDTMIALPGLLLETGRFGEALTTLELFGRHVRRGLVPNRFDDYTGGAHYNTVDASLWFLHAATEYRLRTGDEVGFARLIDPCLKIVEAYRCGTDYEIHLDADGLIASGSAHTQLTWMDAQRDGVTFTPRFGKCVEINALWHHGLRRLAEALREHLPYRVGEMSEMAERCAASFAWFVCPEGGLYDRLQPSATRWMPVSEARPNQIFAASLSHGPLDDAHRADVVRTVRKSLLTPFGLRTLAPGSPGYRGRFEGNLFERDAAYHNGTVWPWLMGPYVEAALRVDDSDKSHAELRSLLRPLTARMEVHCLGQVSEVCGGDEPHTPDGCPAQAWSVGELLRAWMLVSGANTRTRTGGEKPVTG
ncbi:MAG: glycogen debranching enzyme N-terminal domain-containing protein [Phycisphaerales bacterium]|nr:glycogen debranching enzyme N-terminal domain-containing protein [Phycisphaerales bacterium]